MERYVVALERAGAEAVVVVRSLAARPPGAPPLGTPGARGK
ncbi:MAG TPA: hypothetical protein VFP65_16050 [Anaeromyxobacteraceae bacterium]|nr:hypothetical protein [Anaeromyxobacteraceae bacterium]